jgi:hypothetical protein
MAAKNRTGTKSAKINMNGLEPPKSARMYLGELPEQAKLEEGDIVSGFFVGMKHITITDQNTKQAKEIRVYTFRNDNDEKFAVLGRTMLDTAFDDTAEHEGGWEGMIGMGVRIDRGKDTKLKGGKTLGNYSVQCWEIK